MNGKLSRREFVLSSLGLGLVASAASSLIPEGAGQVFAAPALDRLRLGTAGAATTLDPVQIHSLGPAETSILTTGHLFRWGPNHEAVPELAESAAVSEDNLTWTMKLRSGLSFSDGSPLTTDDVLFTWDRIKDLPTLNGRPLISAVQSVTAPDPTTLVWTLSQPSPDFLLFFGSYESGVHPKNQVMNDPDYFTHPVSSGPYVVQTWSPNSTTATLAANPNYARGPLAVNEIDTNYVADLTSRALLVANGQVDYAETLPLTVDDAPPPGVSVLTHPTGGSWCLIFNNRLEGPLADRGVRLAISLALNRDEIANVAYKGLVQPNTSLLYPGALAQPLSTIPNGGQQDLEAARQQLAQTAYSAGFGFKLQVWGSRPGGVDACLVIQQQLKALNVSVDIDNVEDATGLARLGNHDFEVYYQAPTAYPPVALYGNAMQQGNSWTTWTGYNNADADTLIASAATEPDPDKRLAIYMQLEALNAVDLTYIPLHSRVDVHATRVGSAFGYANYSQYPTALTLADLPA